MIYFFDDTAIHSADGLTRVPGPVEKLGVVLQSDRPGDGRRTMSFASSLVPLPGGGWRLYYSVSDAAQNERGIGVAESGDGLRWEKPPLGQLRIGGEDTNRLALGGVPEGVRCWGQPQVFRLGEGEWRMYCWVNQRPYLRYVVARSRDGLDWEVPDFGAPVIYHPLELGSWIWSAGMAPPVEEGGGPGAAALERFVTAPATESKWGHLLHQRSAAELMQLKRMRANDAVYVYRDPDTSRWEFYAPWPMSNPEGSPRRVEHDNAPFMLRAIHRRTSTDGLAWSDGELLIAPDDGDRLDQQFYYLAVHWQEGWRIGMLGSYPCADHTMDIELCFSRDGRRWERPARQPWVPRQTAEEAGMVYAPNRLVDAGEHWLLLYTASPVRHDQIRAAEQATVCAARFPKRRFLGLRAERSGRLWTRPFVLGGTALCVDACIAGELRAALCDPFGTPLPGFGQDRFQAWSGDHTSQALRWDGAALAPYQHDAVSLRLEWERGELFNIHWRS